MNVHSFEVRPVHDYVGADYPGQHQFEAPETEADVGLTGTSLILLLLLVLSLSLGLVGCYLRVDVADDPPQPQVCGGDDDPPLNPLLANLPGCHDGRYEYCEGDALVSRDCEQYCRDTLGPSAYSMGCDAQAQDPCQCTDMIDGGMVYLCVPEDSYCSDERTITVCEEGGFERQSCDEYCQRTLGPMAYSLGCDDQAEDLCQCEYEIVAGEMGAVCFPSSLVCVSDENVQICDDLGESFTTVSCQDYCEQELGSGAVSSACDSLSAEDPCHCEPGPGQV